jgi:hypothetical protein
MFTVELKINGALVGHVYGVNKGVAANGKTSYVYDYYDVGNRKITKGTVKHKRDDGLNKLIALILEDVDAHR